MTAAAATGPTPGPLVHEGAFYRDAAELLALTVPFVRDGLSREEPVLVAAPEDRLASINVSFAERDVAILCPYDVSRLAPAVLADAYRTHPVLVDGAGRRPSPTFAPEQVFAGHARTTVRLHLGLAGT